MQPDIKINLFIAAQNERLEKIASENHRPTFARPKPPLPQDLPPPHPLPSCGGEMEQIGRRNSLMKPELISEIAEVAASRTAPEGYICRAVQL